MAAKKKHNPERRTWRGKSYKAAGRRVRALRDAVKKKDKGAA